MPERTSVDVATQSLSRPAALMAVGTALSRLTGLGRIVAMALALGVAESRLADAYNLANILPTIAYELVLGGVLTSVFVPVLVEELRTKERDEAWRSVSVLFTGAALVLVAATMLLVVTAPLFVDLFTGRAEGEEAADQRDLATFFLRVFAPQVAFFGLAALSGALLNAHGRFALPMFAPILNNLILIGVFLAFALIVSGTPDTAEVLGDPGLKLLLGLGVPVAVGTMALVYLPFLRRLPGRIRPRIDLGHPAVRKLARLSVWTLVYVVVNALGTAVSFYLAGGVQGGLTAYVTAFAFFQLPIGIAAVSISTALVPRLSAHHVDANREAFRSSLLGGFRAMALLMLPATAALVLLADPLVEMLLQHGIVTDESSELVAAVLRLFAIGLLPFAVFQLMMRAFYAQQDARSPATINVWANMVTVGLDFALFPLLEVEGLALAHSLGYVFGVAFTLPILARNTGSLRDRTTLAEIAKSLLASLAAGTAIAVGMLAGAAVAEPGTVRAVIQVFSGGALGLLAFMVVARAVGARDLELLRRLLPRASG